MTLSRQFQEGCEAVAAMLRRFPQQAAEAMTRWAMAQHRPFDLASHGTGPAVCSRCKTDWPCEEYARLAGQLEKDGQE